MSPLQPFSRLRVIQAPLAMLCLAVLWGLVDPLKISGVSKDRVISSAVSMKAIAHLTGCLCPLQA